ncbi:MAG: peptidoglycan binding domain-containing protein [Anaerolineales bacterium]|nr:peptidoglycan binding domain-containing protein [Anaerolineales bacterium]
MSGWMEPPAPSSSDTPPPKVIRVREAQRRRGSAYNWLTLWAILALTFALCLALSVVPALYAYNQFSGRIAPGVSAGGVDLSGMTMAEARTALEKAWGVEAQIRVTNGIQSQLLTPAELGIQIDAAATVQRAHEVGHGGSILAEAAQMAVARYEGWPVTPVILLDESVARSRLESLSPSLSQPAVDAALRYQDGLLTVVPAEIGYTINIDATLAELSTNPSAVMQKGTLVVVPQPVLPQVSDVSSVLAEAQRLLDTSLTIAAYDPIRNETFNWPIPRQIVGEWLTIISGDNGPQAAFDHAKVAAYLEKLSLELGPERYLEPQDDLALLGETLRQRQTLQARVRHRPTTYTVQPGDTLLKIGWNLGMPFWMIVNANPGLDPDRLQAGASLVIPSKDELLPLPMIPNKRIVIQIGQQRLKAYQNNDLIAQHVISTGIDRSPTQPGIFQVQTHDPNAYASIWDLYMPNFLGIYEAWPGFMNGIHGLPMLSNGRRLWANVLGRPASYGCIILDLPAAEWLYQWAENGVVVEIQP